jgi:CHAT domain-containing protein/tetratricopeptide (TPR) repeat protein
MVRGRFFGDTFQAGLLFLLLFSSVAAAQGDPLALQQQAIRRIDDFVEHFRKTGDMRSRLPDLAQAEAELAASNRMLAARGDWSALALGLIKHGHVYRMQGQWPNAIVLYQQAEEAAKRGRDVVRQADALAWRALAESSRRNVGQAFADAAQAVRLAETADDKEVLARALDVLGTVQIAQRDIAGAADTLNREVEVARQAKDSMTAYYAYLNRSDVYLKIGERCDFQRSFEPCYQALDRARVDLQQALAIARQHGYTALARQTEEFISTVEARRGLIKSQEAMHQSVQKTGLFRPKKPGDVLVTEKFVASPGEIPPLLTQIYQEAKRFEKQAGRFADVAEARNQYVEGLMNELQGNNDAALAFFLKAVDTLERDRRALRDERSRGTFLEDRIGFYYAPIQHFLDRRRYAEAFELLERSRSRALADLLASRTLGLERAEEQKLYAELTLLRTQIADAQSKLFELVSDPDAAKNAARISALQGQIRTIEAQHQHVLGRMGTEAPRLQTLVVSAPASLTALQQSMREERYEMLQYLVLEHGVILWHITADSVFVRNVFLPRTEVMAKVAALHKSLADRNVRFDETTATELFLFLVQPALSRIRSERLVIIPHEDLQYLPFQVLQDPADGRYLGERFQITYAPSASVLLALRRSPGLSGGRLLAIADPGIPAAGPEVRAIAQLFPGRSKVVTDTLAQEKDVKAWVRDFEVIHLSVHGKFNAAEPMLSYLSLARGGSDDGRLTAAEMFGLPLDKSRLVVLSACETGRAEATHGNEVLGMVRGLMYAGAGTLVLSYWEVDSDATALWMRTFYDAALSRPMPEAARAALLKVKSNSAYSHPYYWAAFTMIGR